MANYLNNTARLSRLPKRTLKSFIASFLVVLISLAGFSALFLSNYKTAFAEDEETFDGGLAAWAVCDTPWGGKDSMAHSLYEFAFTDNLAYQISFKSAVTPGMDYVDGFANSLVGVGKEPGFREINEQILGYDLETGLPNDNPLNGGTSVTAYDRFGLAGLNWTRYNGEWRYNQVDICTGKMSTLELGLLYEDRLIPRSTYGDISETKDVRTAQMQPGLGSHFGQGMLNTSANWTFSVTKGIVALTISLVNLSFANIVEFFGLNDLIGSDDGVFSLLFQGLYTPLIVIVMVGTALIMAWKGIVKREYRGAINLLVRSILLFLIAVMISVNPLFFVTLPNNIATIAQSLVINAMSTGMAGGSGICTTGYTASTETDINPTAPSSTLDADQAQDLLGEASNTMRSIVDCQIWSTFLLKPWSLGQFGADFNKLYAEGKVPSAAHGAVGDVVIDNEDMVGDAAVPLGGGVVVNNWALFHISTTTNAHALYGVDEPTRTKYISGVAGDWYRIVDALSNYNEAEETFENGGIKPSNSPEPVEAIKYGMPDNTKEPTIYWENWAGGNSVDRIGVAFSSILGAVAGLFTIIFFAFMSMIYSFGIVLMMAFAPLFFLVGSWGNQGWETFKGWGQLVLNLMVRRVIIGLILVLNLIILTTVLNMMGDQDYFWGVAAMGIVSFLLWRFKDILKDTLGGLFTFNFANSNIEGKAGEAFGKLRAGNKKAMAGLGNVAVAGVGAGIVASRSGKDVGKTVWGALKSESLKQARTSNSNFMRQAIITEQQVKGLAASSTEVCEYCRLTLVSQIGHEGTIVLDQDYNKWHTSCFYEKHGGDMPEGFTEVSVQITADGNVKKKQVPLRKNVSLVDKGIPEHDLKEAFRKHSLEQNNNSAAFKVGQLVQKDIINKGDGIPTVPAVLQPYMADQAALVDRLLRSSNPRDMETVLHMYAIALVAYANDQRLIVASNSDQATNDSQVSSAYAELMRGYAVDIIEQEEDK